jgi:hypothetical protein
VDDWVSFYRFGRCQSKTINAGVCIGCAARLLEYFDLVGVGLHPDNTDDQKLVNAVCRARSHRFVTLVVQDLQGWIIFNDFATWSVGGILGDIFEQQGLLFPGLLNTVTGQTPCILHVPGKINMDPYCLYLGLPHGKRRNATHTVFVTHWNDTFTILLLILLFVLCVGMGFHQFYRTIIIH